MQGYTPEHTADSSRPAGKESRLRLVALLLDESQAPELWALRSLASTPCELFVVRALRGTTLTASKRFKRLISQYGLGPVVSRMFGSKIIAPWQERKQIRQLDLLFDGEYLREWWRDSGIEVFDVPQLNHLDARAAIAALQPDIMVRVSGGVLKRETFSLARITTLNIHHGIAPSIRGMWSIPWGIIEGRSDWIGATIHEIDDGIDTGRVLCRLMPQVAPGDTGTTLFFRAHLEAVDALVDVICRYARGEVPDTLVCDNTEPSVYRTAPGLGAWLRYIYLGGGKRADFILEKALR